MLEYIKLLKDFRDAIKAGDWRKAWALAIKIQEIVLGLFGTGAVAMSADEKTEIAALNAEIGELLDATAVPADADSNKWGDGKIIEFLKGVGKYLLPILIGLV